MFEQEVTHTLLISRACHFLCAVCSSSALQPETFEPIRPSKGVFRLKILSEYFPTIEERRWSISVFFFLSKKTINKDRLSLKYISRLDEISEILSSKEIFGKAYATSRNKYVFSLKAATWSCALDGLMVNSKQHKTDQRWALCGPSSSTMLPGTR